MSVNFVHVEQLINHQSELISAVQQPENGMHLAW